MDHKAKFTELLSKLYEKKAENTVMFTLEEYNNLVARLRRLKETGPSSSRKTDYYVINHYDLRQNNKSYQIINKKTKKAYVHIEEVFDCIQTAHQSKGHGGRVSTLSLLKEKYSNITQELVRTFIEGCENCQQKRKKKSKGLVANSSVSDRTISRCQVNTIDLETCPDGDFKYILVYQDDLTKYIRLRPLKWKTAKVVAHELLDIFADLSVPHVLQSDNGREFAKQIVDELLNMWHQCHIVHGKSRDLQSEYPIKHSNQDIEVKLAAWMKDTGSTKWSEGLRFIQFSKNRCFHSDIGKTPYEAMFGVAAKDGLTSLPFPLHILKTLRSEEDLEKLLQSSSNDIEEENSTSQSEHSETLTMDNNNATNAFLEDYNADIVIKEEHGVESFATSIFANETEQPRNVDFPDDPLFFDTSLMQQAEDRESNEPKYDVSNIVMECKSEGIENLDFMTGSEDHDLQEATGFIIHPDSENVTEKFSTCLSRDIECHNWLNNDRIRGERLKCRSVENMLETSTKKLKLDDVGMTVGIPDVNRGHGDLKSILGIVVNMEDDKLYRLGTVHGTLGDLSKGTDCEITLNNAVREQLPSGNTQSYIRCQCTKRCVNKKCKCVYMGYSCNSKCHCSQSCANK